MLSAVTLTHPGAVRPDNEDLVLWDPALGLVAVADGMGGHNAGEVAAQVAIDVLQRTLRSNADLTNAEWPFGFDEQAAPAVNRLITAFRLANRQILQMSQERVEFTGMGTTLTAALIDGGHVWFAHAGDSRLYVKATGESKLRQLTRDDSLVGKLAGLPGVQPLALVNHPMRHLLTNVLGPREELSIETGEITLSGGELLLATTDGMHGAVGDEVMDAILDGHERGMDLQVAAEQLFDAAIGAGGRDNITLALVRYTRD
jgi:protein phosphatase